MGESLLSLALLGAVCASAYTGFALFALCQPAHWRLVTAGAAGSLPVGGWPRLVGVALLTAALGLALWRDGVAFGALLWVVILTLAATLVAFTLSWRPGWLRPLARLSGRQSAQ